MFLLIYLSRNNDLRSTTCQVLNAMTLWWAKEDNWTPSFSEAKTMPSLTGQIWNWGKEVGWDIDSFSLTEYWTISLLQGEVVKGCGEEVWHFLPWHFPPGEHKLSPQQGKIIQYALWIRNIILFTKWKVNNISVNDFYRKIFEQVVLIMDANNYTMKFSSV